MKTVLIVDDDDFLRTMIRHALTKRGFDVVEADDGDIAVEMISLHPEIKFVILDIGMPRMNGKRAYSIIRSTRPDLKCIASSGNITNGDEEELSAMGIKTFLMKPYLLADLYKAVDDLSHQ